MAAIVLLSLSVFVGVPFAIKYYSQPYQVRALRALGFQVEYTGGKGISVDTGKEKESNFNDSAFKHLEGMESIELIAARGKPLTGSGFRYLSCDGLERLIINSSDFDMENLKFLSKMKALDEFSIYGGKSPVSNSAGLRYLSSLTSLRILLLHNTGITDSDFEPLQSLTNLRWLDLSGTRITDKTLKRLSAFEELEDLNLCDTRITADGILSLVQTPSLPSVTFSKDIPTNVLVKLKKALPNTEFCAEKGEAEKDR
jgi:Leucine-rich repeat (LRR) protein